MANTCLERLLEPIGIRIVTKMVVSVFTKTVTSRQRSIGVGCCNTEIVAVLVGVHQVIFVI